MSLPLYLLRAKDATNSVSTTLIAATSLSTAKEFAANVMNDEAWKDSKQTSCRKIADTSVYRRTAVIVVERT